ncbi:MAG: DUF3644 domain-containing protein [Dehalococcoidia bacterium]
MLLCVDLWNRRASNATTSGAVVHANIAWLYLFHARFQRDAIDYWERQNGRRIRDAEGNFRSWPLRRCLREVLHEGDPVRKNLEFFVGIRDKIEHRWERQTGVVVAGKMQALILNYETALNDWFSDTLAEELRFPLFLSSLSRDAAEAVTRIWKELPRALTGYIQGHDADLETTVAEDSRYEFQVALLPVLGPKSSPLAMTFVHEDDLNEEQRQKLHEAVTIIRDRQVPVLHSDELTPGQVSQRVEQALGFKFSPTAHHAKAWKHFSVRPAHADAHPERTDARYCVYSRAFKRYVYTEAWVQKLIRELADSETFTLVTGRAPQPLPSGVDD